MGISYNQFLSKAIEVKRTQEEKKIMTSAGLDPATLSVLTIRDNQLHQPANCWKIFESLTIQSEPRNPDRLHCYITILSPQLRAMMCIN
jgi:hypothetical protein